MKISNIRFGHATNSSSSHSVVVMSPDMLKGVEHEPSTWQNHFGWDDFTLTEVDDKMRYVALQLFHNLERKFGEEMAGSMVHEWTGIDLPKQDWSNYEPIGIDHQSEWYMPDETSDEYLQDFINWIKQDEVVILGGNDNGDGHPLRNKEMEATQLLPFKGYGYYFNQYRKDKDHWIFYSGRTGNKIRFSFDPNAPEYTKSTSPELVDIKITDYCPFGCSFCYQSSTKNGLHASLDMVMDWIDRLAAMGVFEIAIGGGEPTMHPDFVEILEYAHKKGVKPNFTTYSTKWLKKEKIVDAVGKYCGGIGVSVHGKADVETKWKPIKKAISGKATVLAQHALGSVSVTKTKNLITELAKENASILLLGYKEIGFGLNQYEHDISELNAHMRKLLSENHYFFNVSIDTAVVAKYPDLVEALEADPVMISAEEGKFSMYIDAVKNTMGPSSYCPESEMVSGNLDIVQEYANW